MASMSLVASSEATDLALPLIGERYHITNRTSKNVQMIIKTSSLAPGVR
jgi:hypothetical protein